MSKLDMFNDYVIAPGQTITELLETYNITQLELANKTGISKKTINEIIKGKAPITTSTALKFEYVFNLPVSFWNNLESSYRESLERKKDLESIKKDEKYLKNIPYNEMSKRKWDYIEKTRNPYEKIINLRKFFSVASLEFSPSLKKKIAFRKNNNKNFSYESLYCWLRYGEIQANKEEYPKFNIEKLKQNSYKIRELATKPFLKQYDIIKKILKECGIALVFEPHLPNTYVNGVSYKITIDKAIIMISDRGKKDDILWFTLFHEIAHLIKHSKKEVFIDLENGEINNIEKEADEYAKNILIPNNIYNSFIENNNFFNKKIIKDFATKNNISPGILIGRMQKDGLIGWNEYNEMIIRI